MLTQLHNLKVSIKQYTDQLSQKKKKTKLKIVETVTWRGDWAPQAWRSHSKSISSTKHKNPEFECQNSTVMINQDFSGGEELKSCDRTKKFSDRERKARQL